MQKPENTDVYEFGEFRLEAGNQLLWRGAETVNLALKEFEVLFYLVENAGRVVGKTELHEAVWKNTYIEEGTLTQNISRLRKKLEAATDDDTDSNFIETLPKRGYRFLPPVRRRRIIRPAAVLFVNERAVQIGDEHTTVPHNKQPVADLPKNSPVEMPVASAAPENLSAKSQSSKFLWLAVPVLALLVVAAYFAWKTFAPAAPKSLVAANIQPFSGATGRENTPAFSPDGKQLAYSWDGDEGPQTDIYVRLTNGGDPVRLTETDVSEQYPVFSPDGSKVAFVRNLKTYGEVYLIPALGGTEQRICRLFSGNYSISFSPDGKSLAVIDTEDSTGQKQSAVYLVDLENGARRRLTAPGEFISETTPRFSPDGKTIAFVRVYDDSRQDLFTVPINAADNASPVEPKQVTFDQKIIHSLAFSADGKAILFVSFRGSNRAGMWRVAVNSSQEPESVLTGSRDITNLAASPDGKTIAFVENEPHNLDIWQTTATAESKSQKFLTSTFNEFHPAFTPDDSHIVFTSNRSGKNELWESDAAGKNLRQLTKTDTNIGRAVISPDGRLAAFEVRNNSAAGISILNLESGTTREIITPKTSLNLYPVWSQDSRWIYFTSNRTGTEQIWKISADEAGEIIPQQITTQGGVYAVPAPEGIVVFNKSKDKPDFRQLPDQPDIDEQESPITDDTAQLNEAIAWTANRSGIYFFFKDSEDYYTAKFYDFATRQIHPTSFKSKLPTQPFYSLAVSTAGKTFLSATDTTDVSHILLASLEQ